MQLAYNGKARSTFQADNCKSQCGKLFGLCIVRLAALLSLVAANMVQSHEVTCSIACWNRRQ